MLQGAGWGSFPGSAMSRHKCLMIPPTPTKVSHACANGFFSPTVTCIYKYIEFIYKGGKCQPRSSNEFPTQTEQTTATPEIKNTTVTPDVTKGMQTRKLIPV